MATRSVVDLPQGAEPPYRVFVNGVPQTEGEDYRVKGRTLLFEHELVTEGRLGFWRWTLMFLGIAGTYRQHHSVDVKYDQDGSEQVATGLEIRSPHKLGGSDADGAAAPGSG